MVSSMHESAQQSKQRQSDETGPSVIAEVVEAIEDGWCIVAVVAFSGRFAWQLEKDGFALRFIQIPNGWIPPNGK